MTIALVFAALMNLGAYWFSDKIVLAMYGAKALSEAEAPRLSQMVRNFTQRAGMPMPRLYLIPTETPNAFATGRSPDHAAVAVTQGILRILDEEELEGVLAHELAHVRNRDTLTMAIAATLAGAIMWIANMLRWGAFLGMSRSDDDEGGGGILGLIVMAIIAPIAAMLIQMAISRTREFQADASGASLTKKPWALANALEKLEQASRIVPMNASPATAHLFIVNPLRGGSFVNWFSTHPPIEARVARLRAMRIY
ncbi:MAG: zinc metalloprotease HtpX [candidate division NC10 bacterium]|nr:zinc metalloprotease HtpX [candidate division NC10 bacterium]